MTNIIAFRTPPRTGATRATGSGRAEILFFTGVRYVRDEADQPATHASASPRPVAVSVAVTQDERLQA